MALIIMLLVIAGIGLLYAAVQGVALRDALRDFLR